MGESDDSIICTQQAYNERTPAPLNENHLINNEDEKKTKLNMNFLQEAKSCDRTKSFFSSDEDLHDSHMTVSSRLNLGNSSKRPFTTRKVDIRD